MIFYDIYRDYIKILHDFREFFDKNTSILTRPFTFLDTRSRPCMPNFECKNVIIDRHCIDHVIRALHDGLPRQPPFPPYKNWKITDCPRSTRDAHITKTTRSMRWILAGVANQICNIWAPESTRYFARSVIDHDRSTLARMH